MSLEKRRKIKLDESYMCVCVCVCVILQRVSSPGWLGLRSQTKDLCAKGCLYKGGHFRMSYKSGADTYRV